MRNRVLKLLRPIGSTRYWAAFALLVGISLSTLPLFAQAAKDWSEPMRLGLWDEDTLPNFPVLVSDPFGRLHVVTVRNYQGEKSSGLIIYSRLDDKRWTTPVDVLASPNGRIADVERLAAGEDGSLYLLWSENNNGLFWSHSSSLDATSATAWNTRLLMPGATLGDFVVNGENVDLLYVDKNRDIYFQSSTDNGESFSQNVLIWSPKTNDQATFTVRLARGEDNILHAAWTETDANLNWNPSGVWYARSLDGGKTWQDFLNIPDQGSYANIGFDSHRNIHLLWNHNVSSEDGRYHAMSVDGGKTWSKPEVIFPGLSGRTGFPQLVLDNAGILHQFTSGRGLGLEGGIYHSLWLGDRWGTPVLISKPVPEDNNEGPTVAITSGNLFHVAWRNNFNIHDVLYSFDKTDAPEKPVLPMPVTLPSTNIEPSPTPERPTPSPPKVSKASATDAKSSEGYPGSASSLNLLLIGVMPAALLVTIAVVWNW
jgi:hypothetical protein